MQILTDPMISDEVLSEAVACVRRGGDASRRESTARTRRLKGVESNKPILVLTDTWERVDGWISADDGLVKDLMAIASVHSITILFPATTLVPESLIATSREIGIRLCRHDFCVRLIQQSDKIISSTSANFAGSPPPTQFTDVDEAIRSGSDYSVDGGILSGTPSTIVRAEGGRPNVLREGSLTRDEVIRLLS